MIVHIFENRNKVMAPKQRKTDLKQTSSNTPKSTPSSNSNIWILAIAFAALVFYVLYQSVNIYSKDRMYNDFE
ncbi:unnamed protein product [Rotaria sp. Silwood1]|nr:unnamed protein product [Rotaria sp. Silwood1]CAF3713774.1 unnamed protein product [Rotaria sp. Silwood1]CAF4974723.1 unnamed protein product [Rotaria sp. Silwood1]CAF5079637.1 unnamed protein product [Rotaria sp. Silwood1]